MITSIQRDKSVKNSKGTNPTKLWLINETEIVNVKKVSEDK